MTWSGPIAEALELPGGARFYRCALQVNPFDYLERQGRKTPFQEEASYNRAMIEACQSNGIEVIAVTDHFRVQTATGLWKAASEAGLHVFPGFEAMTKDGIHLLCLFDEGTKVGALERVLGACGIHDEDQTTTSKLDTIQFLEESRNWGAICIAAHVASAPGGLLVTLKGQPRVNAWLSPHLLACSLPGPVSEAPENLRAILTDEDRSHRRGRSVAILNAQDVDGPEDLGKPGASCWVKMSKVSVEGLRQAFLDPKSRIRLASDPAPEEHAEFVAMAWEGGFLDGTTIRFNENLNVFVGGRGTGKSTVVESVRYVLGLEPLGEEALRAHEGIVQNVLRGGTKVSLLVRSHRPAPTEYLIERTVPNPPVLRGDGDHVLELSPRDILSQVEVYGQHEISELTRSPEKLTRLLERFVEPDPNLSQRKMDLRRGLGQSRRHILELRKELGDVEERLASLPALEERLQRFQRAGIEKRLKEQSLLISEEQVLKTAEGRLEPFREVLESLKQRLPVDRSFLGAEALDDLPRKRTLRQADKVLRALNEHLEGVADQIAEALRQAEEGLTVVRTKWEEEGRSVRAALERILRQLQSTKLDGAEFMELRRQVEELRPLRERQAALEQELKRGEKDRRKLLTEWEDVKTEEFRQLDRAAARVSGQLAGRVRVQVAFAGNREPLFRLLRNRVGGRLSESIDVLRRQSEISLKEFADACRAGRAKLEEEFGLPGSQAERLAEVDPEIIMEIEELDLPPTTQIELNVGGDGKPPVWRALEDLSTGQKATAVLLLLLLESEAPLVVDQPEDDLDNRFITEGVVPKMREEKRRRQFVYTTHNANIPVLGDAELIAGLSASGEAGRGKAEIRPEHIGSIDDAAVRELVEEILEGGKEAFEMRRLKYGF